MRFSTALFTFALLLGSQPAAHATGTLESGERCCSLFPASSGPLVINVADDGPSLRDIATSYSELTAQSLVLDEQVATLLERSTAGLQASVTVPAREVQSFFEQLLVANGFVLNVLRSDAPRALQIRSLQSRALRSKAHFVSADELEHFAKHPATLITTAVELPNSDVRQLSTSLRALMTDNNTQSIIAAGQSNTLVVTDFGKNAAKLVKLVKLVDAESADTGPAQPVFAVIPLEHANAKRVMKILSVVLRPAKQGEGATPTGRTTAPRITADERTNSLVIAALPADMDRIKGLVVPLGRRQ